MQEFIMVNIEGAVLVILAYGVFTALKKFINRVK